MEAVNAASQLKTIRWILSLFIAGLILSGVTAFPLVSEVQFLHSWFEESTFSGLAYWLGFVREGLEFADSRYPFLAYGTDWLAFAHIVIAIAFLGPIKDPVKNIWVVEFGMIACILVIPLALICGHIRGIPFFWQLIDCSFGVVGLIPLAIVRKLTMTLMN
jgi:hypothetical protein